MNEGVGDAALHSFAAEPGASELRQLPFRARAAARVVVHEDDTSIVVREQPFSFAAFASLVLVLLTMATLAPLLLLPGDGARRPGDVDRGALLTMVAVLWLVVVPALLWLGRRARRAAARLVDGAVVDKQSGELWLPQSGLRVPRSRVVRFVLVEGRFRRGTVVMPFCQCAVLFRDEQQRWGCAPIACTVSKRAGRAALQRLADCFAVPVQRVADGALHDRRP